VYEWYALAASGCCCSAGDERISWRARGDIGDVVHRGSLGDSELRTTLAWHSEMGAAASTKAVWWDLRLASMLTHLFVYFFFSLFYHLLLFLIC